MTPGWKTGHRVPDGAGLYRPRWHGADGWRGNAQRLKPYHFLVARAAALLIACLRLSEIGPLIEGWPGERPPRTTATSRSNSASTLRDVSSR